MRNSYPLGIGNFAYRCPCDWVGLKGERILLWRGAHGTKAQSFAYYRFRPEPRTEMAHVPVDHIAVSRSAYDSRQCARPNGSSREAGGGWANSGKCCCQSVVGNYHSCVSGKTCGTFSRISTIGPNGSPLFPPPRSTVLWNRELRLYGPAEAPRSNLASRSLVQ